MLPAKNRLKKNKDFARVAKEGRVAYDKGITLKWIDNDLAHSRLGVVCSLKVSKKAVVRNKIKRRIRSYFRKQLSRLKPGFDLLVLTRPQVIDFDYQKLGETLDKVLQKANLILK